jgi:L-arabinose isomerase
MENVFDAVPFMPDSETKVQTVSMGGKNSGIIMIMEGKNGERYFLQFIYVEPTKEYKFFIDKIKKQDV